MISKDIIRAAVQTTKDALINGTNHTFQIGGWTCRGVRAFPLKSRPYQDFKLLCSKPGEFDMSLSFAFDEAVNTLYTVVNGGDTLREACNIEGRLIVALQNSDDWLTYQNEFVAYAQKMIATGITKLEDFEEQGGFTRATLKGAYFIYAGEMHIKNRWYLDIKTGKFFQLASV